MINAIIIDDDSSARELISRTIEAYCPNVIIVKTAKSVKTGVAAINEHTPDLVLLDIKMNDGSGFDVIRHFDKPDFKVIIISGFIEYAIKGYKYGAVDYILKPVNIEELASAINRAEDLIRFEEKLKAESFKSNIEKLGKSHKIVLKTSEQIHMVNLNDIIRIEAEGNYSTFYMQDGRNVLVSTAIKEYEEMLIDKGFHRVHKSHIINIEKMHYFDKTDRGDVVMCDGAVVPVSHRKRDMLFELFDETE